MKIRIDYLNKDKQVRHISMNVNKNNNLDLLWWDIYDILEQWATDIIVYNLTNKKWEQ